MDAGLGYQPNAAWFVGRAMEKLGLSYQGHGRYARG